MNFCGIICEFNPFHNGHQYIIEKAKQLTGAEIVCLMSGQIVQRGEPAIEDKYQRALDAINSGASMVVELPTIYACSNAENFAYGAIKTLNALGVNTLVFGIEQTDLTTLQKVAKLKLDNTLSFQNAFKNEVENGINYNTALKRSIAKTLDDENILEVLSKPNNVLAVEYLTAILKLKSKIKVIAVERIDNGYYNNQEKNNYLSASSIRKLIFENADIEKYIPKHSLQKTYFNKEAQTRFETAVIYNLRNSTSTELETCYDYSEGIEYRIKKCADEYSTLAEISSAVSSPRYRVQRVNKLLIYPILKATKSVVKISKTTKPVAKLLAIQKTKKHLLSNFNKHKINLICTNKDYSTLSQNQKKIIEIDLLASNLYNLATKNPNNNDKKIGTMFV